MSSRTSSRAAFAPLRTKGLLTVMPLIKSRILVGLLAVPACALFAQPGTQDRIAPVGSGPATERWIFAQLIDHDRVRSDALLEYNAMRVYRVSDPNGKIHAEEVGRMEFHAPD